MVLQAHFFEDPVPPLLWPRIVLQLPQGRGASAGAGMKELFETLLLGEEQR
jgi:hypothetical protein